MNTRFVLETAADTCVVVARQTWWVDDKGLVVSARKEPVTAVCFQDGAIKTYPLADIPNSELSAWAEAHQRAVGRMALTSEVSLSARL